jgi:Zn-dependent protease with chaperone function
MDFFGHQADARKKTSLLVVYYILAVILIIVAVYTAFAVAIFGVGLKTQGPGEADLTHLWNPEVFLGVLIGTVIVVAAGTLYKIGQLARGGAAVAQMLGGRRVAPNTTAPAERRLLNVVEEMSIASGTPVASVYILDDEAGINAFAAGFSQSDAVVAATRGCVERLTRDELQGVIAHEFSHILNGDMRLNIKLTGILHGILLISLIGYWIMRSSGSRGSSRSKKGGGQIALLGFLLWIIGYIGVFFGKLIKSAVSRQREFLADASAVQFTRNPDGLAGALKKIGGCAGGSRVMSSNAEQASHFFFANGLADSFMSMFATHPPLAERIARIDPVFSAERGQARRAAAETTEAAGMAAGFSGTGTRKIAVKSDNVVASVGQPGLDHLAYASRLLSSIPPGIDSAIRNPASASAAVYCLLLSGRAETLEAQRKYLKANADAACMQHVDRLAPEMAQLGPEYRIALADIAVTALREMSREHYDRFIANIDWLTAADQEIDLFEYALKALVKRRLQPVFSTVDKAVIQYYDIKPLTGDACRLASCIAYWGADRTENAVRAFNAGISRMGLGTQAIVPADQCGLDMVDAAIRNLNHGSPFVKKRVIEGCIECIATDGRITVDEAELVRAIADGLDCPVPPITAGPLGEKAA